jgi:O-antigen ligase
MTKSRIVIYLLIALMTLHLLPAMYFTGIFTLVILVIVILLGNLTSRVKTLLRNKIFWILLIPFLAYAISITWSDDIPYAWKKLEIGLSILTFPIMFGLIDLDRKDVFLFLKSMILLIAFLPILGFIHQYTVYLDINDTGVFYNDNLVSIFEKQAVYYGFFINTALFTLFILWQQGELRNKISKIIGIICFFLLVWTQYFLASRTAIAISVLIVITFSIIFMIKYLRRMQIVFFSLGFVLLTLVMVFSFPKVLKRFQSIEHVNYQFDNPNPINHFNGEIKKENWNGLNTRLAIWECTIDAIQMKPLIGHGIGDGQKQLVEIYNDKNFILAKTSNYNTHNQYLHFALIGGLVGFFAYLGHLLYFIRYSFSRKHWLLFGFMLIYMMTCLTENVLGRNQGLVFISLILSLFAYFSNKTSNNIS